MLFVTPFAWRKAGSGFWRTQRLPLQLLRSAFLLTATACFFGALRYLPLAEGSAITFLAPIFVVVLSGPLLGERPSLGRWIVTISGFCGILILARPGSAVFHPAGLLLVLAALSNALFFLLTRKLAEERVHTTLFYSALVGSVCLSLALPWAVELGAPSAKGAWFLALGLFAGAGHWLIVSAFQHAQPSLLTPFSYLQMIWATLYGYLIFGQLPDAWSAVGMTVIVASGLLLALQERRGARSRRV
jgi:drug/metabolite transporter (DMT)-like permease